MARIFGATVADFAGLSILRDMNEETFAGLSDALSKGPILLRTSELEAAIAGRIPETAQAVADVLVKMAFTARRSGMKIEDLILDVTETIRVGSKPPWSAEELARWRSIAPQLCKLAQNERIQVLAKALDLTYAHASVYQRAQIITDVRPVFDMARERPAAAIISHTLQVTYSRDGDSQTVTMTLDDADVRQLIEQATAAKHKSEKLLEFLQQRLGGEMRLEIAGATTDDES